jgi:hypothetical protein
LHVLAKIKLIRLARQAAVARQETDQRELLLTGEQLVALHHRRRRNHLHHVTSVQDGHLAQPLNGMAIPTETRSQ